MKIVVLNGSPKGDTSVTIHSVKYLQKKFPEHDFNIINIAKRIKGIERRRGTFDEIIAEVSSADGVLWAFPLYVLMVPARLKRFIELIYEWGAESAFAGKYSAAISTSVVAPATRLALTRKPPSARRSLNSASCQDSGVVGKMRTLPSQDCMTISWIASMKRKLPSKVKARDPLRLCLVKMVDV